MWSSIWAVLAWRDPRPCLGCPITLGCDSWSCTYDLPLRLQCKIQQCCWFWLVKMYNWFPRSIGSNWLFISEDWSDASQIWSSMLQQSCQRSPWLGWQHLITLLWICYYNSITNLLQWWFVVMIRQSRIIPRSCQSQMLLTRSPSYFSLLDQFQINLNYIIFLSTALYRQIDLGCHTWRSCFPFLPIFCFWVNLFLVTSYQIVSCWHTWLECLLFFKYLVGTISTTIFSYRSDIAVL